MPEPGLKLQLLSLLQNCFIVNLCADERIEVHTITAEYTLPQFTRWIPSALFASLVFASGTGFARVDAMREAVPRSLKINMVKTDRNTFGG